MRPAARKIDEEAARWAVRLSAGPLDPAEQEKLERWLSASPRQRGALIRARATWLDLDRFAALSGGTNLRPLGHPLRLERRHFLAASMTVSMLAGGGVWFARRGRGETYASGIGEQRVVKLSDQSSLTLNTDSLVSVHFDQGSREVRLLKGEALFEVAQDKGRPFVVRAGALSVTAVGTAFAVRRDGSTVDVTVSEGVVELSPERETAARPAQRVMANQLAIVTAERPVVVRTLSTEETERRLAWRGGMLVFDGEPLSEAVAEINRHSRRQIVIRDSALADRPIVGIFRAKDTTTFVSAASAVLGAQAVEKGDVIELRTSSSP
jgi:transmembrane sensor